jgi:mono/diheme cytochrome c family protein
MTGRIWTAAAGFVAMFVVALAIAIVAARGHQASVIKDSHGDKVELTAAERRGRDVFRSSCASCHKLDAVAAAGVTGPSLDFVRPTQWMVRRRIREGSVGRMGTMPPAVASGQDADDVADFVARVAGR